MLTFVRSFTTWILLLIGVGLVQAANADPVPSPGFLVIAPDRGYLGNEEIKTVWAGFRESHLTRLVFISLAEDYERAVRAMLQGAVADMQREGATEVVLIPLVLSDTDPHLKKAKELLASAGVRTRTAPVFGSDPLAGQILEDRVRALSKEPRNEQLVVVGYGVSSLEEAKAMTRALQQLADEVRETLHLANAVVGVLYHGKTPDSIEEQGNQRTKARILSAIEQTDLRSLVVPFHLGYKYTGLMRLGWRIESLLSGHSVAYDGLGILPDPLVTRWFRKAASPYLAFREEELGIVVMAHGAGEYHNDLILASLEPLREKFTIEVSFMMMDVGMLQAAIDKLEARGARSIHVLRLYTMSRSLQANTWHVLGLTNVRGSHAHHNHPNIDGPSRVRSGALLSTSGGFDAHPLIAEVLLQRALKVSRSPAQETVILLGHGAGKDEDNQFWVEQMEKLAEFIQANAPRKFRSVKVATVREDWPEKRARAVAQVRNTIEEATRDGNNVLIISHRMVGAGPYRELLTGLEYTLNGQGIVGHPNLTRWIEEQIEGWIGSLTLQRSSNR